MTGAMKTRLAMTGLVFGVLALGPLAQEKQPGLALIPAGDFEMGDHHGFVDPGHASDEVQVHTVRLDAFYMGVNDVTTREYCEFLNAALALKQIVVRDGGVYLAGGSDLLAETRAMSPYSRIGWNGQGFGTMSRNVCVSSMMVALRFLPRFRTRRHTTRGCTTDPLPYL